MDALKPLNSKYVTLTMRGGFFTKFATLAHGVPPTDADLPQLDCQDRFDGEEELWELLLLKFYPPK